MNGRTISLRLAGESEQLEMYSSHFIVIKREFSQKRKLSIYQSITVYTLTDLHEHWVMTKRTWMWIQASDMAFFRAKATNHSQSLIIWGGLSIWEGRLPREDQTEVRLERQHLINGHISGIKPKNQFKKVQKLLQTTALCWRSYISHVLVDKGGVFRV